MGFVDLNNGSGGPGTSGYGPVPTLISRHVDTNGNGTGTKNAIGDYSGAQEIFYIQPSSTQIFRITRMMVLVRGDKNTFYTDAYGSRTALTNGIIVHTRDDSGTLINLTDDVPILTNGNWGRFCFDSEIYPANVGSSDTYLRVRWTFEKSGYPIRLVGSNNERLEVCLNDDFSLSGGQNNPLAEHYFLVQGYIEGTT